MAQKKNGKKLGPTIRSICRLFAAIPIKIFDRFTSSTSLSDWFCHRSILPSTNFRYQPIFAIDRFLPSICSCHFFYQWLALYLPSIIVWHNIKLNCKLLKSVLATGSLAFQCIPSAQSLIMPQIVQYCKRISDNAYMPCVCKAYSGTPWASFFLFAPLCLTLCPHFAGAGCTRQWDS